MVRILVLVGILAAQMGAATVSGPCPVPSFTLGHTTISNCQTNITTSTPFDGGFTTLGLSPNGTLAFNTIDLREPGAAFLNSGPVAESFLGTITGNFTMDPGWALDNVNLMFIAQDTNIFQAVSENVFLDAPCVTVVPGGASGAGCSIPSLPSSGTITLRLDIHSQACPGCVPEDAGQVGPGDIFLHQLQVTPEPGTAVFIGLGIVVVRLRSRRVFIRAPRISA